MHKETLKTAYSSNPEENLLNFADENDFSDSSIKGRDAKEEIKGWINQITIDESRKTKLSSDVSERKKSVPTHRRLFYSRASSRNEENRDSLKLKLHDYLNYSDDEPSFEFEKTSIEEKTDSPFLSFNSISIDPKESRSREQQSKSTTKSNSKTSSRNHSRSSSMKLRGSCSQNKQEKSLMTTSFRLKTHKKMGGCIFVQPLAASFPCDQEESKLQEKLNSYLRTHIKLHKV